MNAARLDAAKNAPAAAAKAETRRIVCRECGAGHATASTHGEFCGPACRRAWNNRRMVRGAEFYDLFMALRYERARAKPLKLWKLICRMAAMFRDEDVRDRAGRKSWGSPETVLERKPYLLATVVQRGRK